MTTAGVQRRAAFTGLYAFFATVIMLFGAFTSAMVVRRGASKDWKGVPQSNLLWVNTGVLALSSAAAEKARRDLAAGNRVRFNIGWCAATLLGAGFVAGQFAVWQHLRHTGVYINSHPGSAFFYVGTVAHALHLAGGWIAMLYLAFRALRLQLGPSRRTAVDITTLYWHFLGVLWLYLLWLFWFWGIGISMQRELTWNGGGSPLAIGSKPLGMWLFVVSDALTFATLLVVYTWCRLANPAWPSPFDWASIAQATAMTFVLLTSSFTMALAVHAMRLADSRRAVRMLSATIGLGLAFLVLHAREWLHLIRDENITLASNPWGLPLFGATFFGLTGLHMLHVTAGVIYLGIVAAGVSRRRFSAEDVETSGLYWHFVDLVWMFLFPLVYLMSRKAEAEVHALTPSTLVRIWLALLALTLLEVVLAIPRLASVLLLIVLLALSLGKTALIVNYFMHLKFSPRLLGWLLFPLLIAFIASLLALLPDAARIGGA